MLMHQLSKKAVESQALHCSEFHKETGIACILKTYLGDGEKSDLKTFF